MSMQGYDLDEAVKYFESHINPKDHKAFTPSELSSLLRLAAEADLDYMEESGVLKDGIAGIAPGQSAVFYRGDEVVGGGIIRAKNGGIP